MFGSYTMFHLLCCFLLAIPSVSGFTVGPASHRQHSTTRLFIQDSVAEMIDQEYWREHHKKEFEIEWMEKNKEAVLHTLRKADNGMGNLSDNSGIGSLVMDVMAEPEQEFRQMVKDRRLARTNPRQYCADRCIAAGYCDVYEDLFHYTPEEVVAFCKNCVLTSDGESCNIPDEVFDKAQLMP